jgi:hypothetical protein
MAGAIGAENVSVTTCQIEVAGLSDREIVTYKKRCMNVLSNPQKYDDDIDGICRLIKRQKI